MSDNVRSLHHHLHAFRVLHYGHWSYDCGGLVHLENSTFCDHHVDRILWSRKILLSPILVANVSCMNTRDGS